MAKKSKKTTETIMSSENTSANKNEVAQRSISMSETAATAEAVEFKRADGKVSAPLNFIRPSKLAEAGTTGIILQGIYEGSEMNELTKKLDYKFRLEDDSLTIINGSGNLGSQMKNVSEGQLCRITYNGKVTMKSGTFKGTQAHNFVVEVA